MIIRRDPFNIDCPVCTARAGEPCRVAKRAGTYSRKSTRHYQDFAAARAGQPMHLRRIEEARIRTTAFRAFPGELRGRAAYRAAIRRILGQ